MIKKILIIFILFINCSIPNGEYKIINKEYHPSYYMPISQMCGKIMITHMQYYPESYKIQLLLIDDCNINNKSKKYWISVTKEYYNSHNINNIIKYENKHD